MAKRVALFGGSFDPIHFGHLISARSLAERCGIGQVVLIPAPRPPHKNRIDLSDARDRLAMCRLAVAGDRQFDVSDIELQREGPSYTIDTVDAYRERCDPSTELSWIVGADSLIELHTWHRVAELVHRVSLITARRQGCTTPRLEALESLVGGEMARRLLTNTYETPVIDISASAIRERVRGGLSIRYMTPNAVVDYIHGRNLYREGERG